VSACKIDVAGSSVFLSQPLGMWALYVMVSISPVWLMCSSPLSWWEKWIPKKSSMGYGLFNVSL
jgi:hypothetical protein